MATISITIPDAQLQRVLDGMVPVPVGGETQGETAKNKIIKFVKDTVLTQEQALAREAVKNLVGPDVS